MVRHTMPLETITVTVPEDAVETFEAALLTGCDTIGLFLDESTALWRLEGVRQVGTGDANLTAAIALANAVSGLGVAVERAAIEADGWISRTYNSFPEQSIGRRFLVRGEHLARSPAAGRIMLKLNAGAAFGSGEHNSTRGCLLALEQVAYRRPRRILDLGAGSGILAMAAAALLHRPVLAIDIDPWSVRVTRENATANDLRRLVRPKLSNGWGNPALRGPFDLVFANILARPLCTMAKDLAGNLAPGGTAILAGLLSCQVRWVLAAHRRNGLYLERLIRQGSWTTIVLRKPNGGLASGPC